MLFCNMDKVIFLIIDEMLEMLFSSTEGFSVNCSHSPDAVLVVGNGRLLRSWDITFGGLNWEIVLDSGR